jgi:L-ascorbate metabolism protein UlaG (beta-lactamase superfamily)
MLTVRLVGGPTAILEYAGLRLLTDPAFSPPGEYDRLTKTTGPALSEDEVGAIDAVLLSHDHHADNLDPAGRAFLPRAGRVLTTIAGAERLEGDNATGLEPWSTTELGAVTVTAVPAQHGPDGTDHLTGPVIGFVLTAPDAPPLYVSGDNASVEVVEAIAKRLGPIELAVLFAGGVQVPDFGEAYLTLSGERAVAAARVLEARAVVPLHFEGWTHFTQGAQELRDAFADAGLQDRLSVPERGGAVTVA